MTNTLQQDVAVSNAIPMVKRNEGYQKYTYKDSDGNDTIGYGFLLSEGFTEEECAAVLEIRLASYEKELSQLQPLYNSLDENQKPIILDMLYNMGVVKLMGFTQMWKAIADKDDEQVVKEMLDSKWATQVGSRAQRDAMMWKTGKCLAAE